MNFQNLQDLTVYWLDDLNYGYFTPTQVQRWINNAQYEVQKLLLQAHENFYLTVVQTTMVVGQTDYVLPTDFMKLHRLEIVLSGTIPNETKSPLGSITTNQQDLVNLNSNGTPQFYSVKSNRLVLYPAPDTALTLRLYYSPRVTEMSLSTDIPNVPVHYHEFISVLAARDGFIKDGRDNQAILAKLAYYEKMLKDDAEERQEDAPRSVVQTGQESGQLFGFF